MLSTNRRRPTRNYIVSGVVALAVLLLAVTSLSDPGGGGFPFVMLLLIPGVIGGTIALAILGLRGGPARSNRLHPDPFAGRSTDVINYSRLRVAGIGGLGLIVMAGAVALDLPRVGQSVEIGLVGGVLAAVLVVLYRRKKGPLSTHNGPRGNAFLVVDDDEEPTPGQPNRRPTSSNRALETGASV